jgi:hypothetical protein
MSHLRIYSARRLAIALFIIALLGIVQDVALARPRWRGDEQVGAPSVRGSVVFAPDGQAIAGSIQPHAYLVILDATSSMSWNFAGQGTRNGRDVQCGPSSDPNILRESCGAGAPWRHTHERRIYAAKQAIRWLIDQLDPNDTMRLLAFSTRGISTNERWTANKRRLRHALLDLGSYQHEPYRTAGEAPGASALFRARQSLVQMPRTAPNGLPYGQLVVIFITDSVANRFLKPNGGWEKRPNDTCPNVPFADDIGSCQVGYTSTNPPLPKPITAMMLQADLLKQGATVYVIALAGVDETGLTSVASAPNYPYFSNASRSEDLLAAIQAIPVRIIVGTAARSTLPSTG